MRARFARVSRRSCRPIRRSFSDDAVRRAAARRAGAVIGDFYRGALTLTSIAGHSGAPQVALPLGFWQGGPRAFRSSVRRAATERCSI